MPVAAPPRLVRAFGAVVLAAGALTLVRAGLTGGALVTAAVGLMGVVLGGTVIAYTDRLTLSDVAWISALCTLLVAAAVASRPTPYGAGITYAWIAPFAFIAGRRAGAAMVALSGSTLAVAFAVQAARLDHPLALKTYVSWWLATTGTVVVVGLITRGLVASLATTQEQLESGFLQGVLGKAFLDAEGRWQRVNPAFAVLLGRDEAELAGMLPNAVTHPDDLAVSDRWMERLQADDQITFEKRYLRPDGDVRWITVRTAALHDGRGRRTGYFSEYEDVTARRVAEEHARESRRRETALAEIGRHALALESLPDLLAETVRLVAATLDASHATLLAATGGDVLAAETDDGEPVRAHAAAVLDAPGGIVLDGARSAGVAVRGAGEQPFAVLLVHATDRAPFDEADVAFLRSTANVLTAALRREAAERELRHRALHDPLTHLPNRALLVDRLRLAVPRARRDGRALAVLSIDLDDFKGVNESHGRHVGDELLRLLAARLQGALRANDTLARLGADEFVALCEGLEGPEEALAVAERLLASVAGPQSVVDCEIRCSASIGIAFAGAGDDGDAEGLLRDADLAMRRAKAAGRGRYEVFEHAMRTRALQRVALTGDLDRALERGEFELAFQPIVGLDDGGRVHAAESLVRWHHPERGLVMPDEFIGLAERTGRIVDLGRWVIRDAARQAAQWPQLTVGVNVSRRQLTDPALVGDVAAALAEHGVPPNRFCVEVTETALMDDPAAATRALHGLHDLGVKISLDDFGTGYSSLSSLREFPLNTIKLDRSFLPCDPTVPHGWSIVRAVLDLARTLSLDVVAEGIETEVQRSELERMGCGLGQGYLFSRPVPGTELSAVLLSRSASSPAAAPYR
ncbi:MAG TPA: EAL domain-containing protein [Baekduia sp.]